MNSWPEATSLNSHYELIKGKPDCNLRKLIEDEKWEFLAVRRKRFVLILKRLLIGMFLGRTCSAQL